MLLFSLPPSTPTLIRMRSGNQPQTHRKFFFFVLLSISVHNEDERFVNTPVRVNVCRCSRDLLQSARHGERRENVPQSQQITGKLNEYFNIILFFDAQCKELQNNNPDIQSNPASSSKCNIHIYICGLNKKHAEGVNPPRVQMSIDLLPFSACENTRGDLASPHPEKHFTREGSTLQPDRTGDDNESALGGGGGV